MKLSKKGLLLINILIKSDHFGSKENKLNDLR